MARGKVRRILRLIGTRFFMERELDSPVKPGWGLPLERDFGPSFGIDYARFSDVPDVRADDALRARVLLQLGLGLCLAPEVIKIFVRNRFVFLTLPDDESVSREHVRTLLSSLKEIVTVEISQGSEGLRR